MNQRGVEPTFRSGGVAWEIALALLVVALIVACAAAFVTLQVWLSHRILPGVQVWDVDVSGLARDEAAQRLEASFRYPVDRHPTLVYGAQTWRISPEDLGLQLDAAATAAAAYSVGHAGQWTSRLKDQVETLLAGRVVMPVFAAEPGGGAMLLARLADQVDLPLRNATLRLGDDLSVQIVPGQPGRTLDQEATRQVLLRRLAEISGGAVAPIVQESEPLITDVSAAQAQTQRLLSGPVTLTAPGFDAWTIEPRTLAGWLTLRPTAGAGGRSTLAVSLDTNQVTRLAEQIAAQVARAPTDAQFRWDDATGGIVPVVYSAAGQTLDVAAAESLIEAAAAGEARSVALPLVEIPPALATEDAPKLGIVELIGEGITRFAGSSEARVQNITVGASQFDGLLVAPGETFSFNQTLGEVTAERGYAEGIIIWGNTTRADVGGGLCQVSSTAFRAAFWAGVPILERTPHAFRVSYYEPPKGMDATIYSPSVDLKWLNDTGHYILVHTTVDKGGQTLTFRYYGTNPGRTVELDGPQEDNPVPHGPDVLRDDPTLPKGEKKQIEWAKDGLDVTIYRVVKENGVEVRRDMFFSRYLPWQAVYLVGTKE